MPSFSVSCGGTGGHVFPGVATAMALCRRGHQVSLWMEGKAIETATRQAWDGPVVEIGAEALSFHPAHLPRTLTILVRSCLRSSRALRRERPAALLAMGSYSSLAPVIAARIHGIPVVLHEANVIPGKAVSWLSPFATRLAITFPETRQHVRHSSIHVTGLPLRPQLEQAALQARSPGGASPFTVLVMGGSQGAQHLNQVTPAVIKRLQSEGLALRVIHLAGPKSQAEVEAAYKAQGVEATVYGFCTDMVSVYRQASLALSRSGANSCLELALFGIPAILIPYPGSARDHQLANARAMASAGAAQVIEQQELTEDRLDQVLRHCWLQPGILEAMAGAARTRRLSGAADQLAELVEATGLNR